MSGFYVFYPDGFRAYMNDDDIQYSHSLVDGYLYVFSQHPLHKGELWGHKRPAHIFAPGSFTEVEFFYE